MALKKKGASKKKTARKTAAKKKPIKKLRPNKTTKIKLKTRIITAKSKAKSKTNAINKAKNGNIVGKIIHYFPHVKAAVIKLSTPLSIGDKIRIKGHTTDFTQSITSMQMDRVDITSAKPKEEIGLLVNSRVRKHDIVYKA